MSPRIEREVALLGGMFQKRDEDKAAMPFSWTYPEMQFRDRVYDEARHIAAVYNEESKSSQPVMEGSEALHEMHSAMMWLEDLQKKFEGYARIQKALDATIKELSRQFFIELKKAQATYEEDD